MQTKVWFVTGGAKGIGKEIVLAALANGDRVVATSRSLASLGYLNEFTPSSVLALSLDITDSNAVDSAVKQAIDKFGEIDVLINNAGYGQLGAIEELSNDNVHLQMEANVYGPIYLIRAALPFMRERRKGHIINLSSIAGLVGSPGLGMYNASKFALEGFSEALSLEVKPLGITVTLIEPGGVRTDFAGDSLQQPGNPLISDYEETRGKTGAGLAKMNGNQPSDAVLVAKAILDIANSDAPPLRLILGADALPRFKNKLEQLTQEVAAWEAVTLSVAFKD